MHGELVPIERQLQEGPEHERMLRNMPDWVARMRRRHGLPAALKVAFLLAERLYRWYVRVPDAWLQLDSQRLAAAVVADHRSLDYYYATPVAKLLGQVVARARIATGSAQSTEPLEQWVPFFEDRQRAALARLAALGLKRMPVGPGDAFAPDRVEPSGEPPLPTTQLSLDGKVASVTPGRGGWLLNGQVIVPAEARAYRLTSAG